jgi:formylglycine-generating enzyme required for sulfatase activity
LVRITKPFYIGKYKVTQEVWEKVMGANPSFFKGAKNPVENVSWDDCQEFLKKLNERNPHPIPLPLGEGARVRALFRLPTEAEWEWACRAGTRTRYCFGDEERGLADYGWYDGNSGKTTHPVGGKKPNAWGLYDCHGNVWEWCGGWYDEYHHGWWPKADPTGPATGSDHVLRGGSWGHYARGCRSASRSGDGPGNRLDAFGFRVVRSSSRTP